MESEAANGNVLRRVCSSCGHVNDADTEYCLQCGAPIGHVPGVDDDGPAPVDDGGRWGVFGMESHLVGRDEEIGFLVEQLRAVIDQEAARIVHVRGPEGIGKSRLVDAFHQSLEHEVPEALLISSRGTGTADNAPYAAIHRIIRARFYIPPHASDGEARERLREGVRSLLDEEDGPEVARRVEQLVGLAETGSAGQSAGRTSTKEGEDAAQRALARVLRADARQNPIVLVFEDLQRLGEETRELIAWLFAALVDVPILIVVTSDEGFELAALGLDDDALAEVAPVLNLDPLADDDIAELVRTLLRRAKDVPASIVDFVSERAVGNPLAAEEILRILIAEGAIDTRGNEWTIYEERTADVEIPFDFEDVVRARLERLDADERALLTRAACVGSAFWSGALVALERSRRDDATPGWQDAEDETRIRRKLEAFVARDLIRRNESSAFAVQDEFSFKHGVERRLLVETLADDERARYERTIAVWMTLQSGGDNPRYAARIGEHFEAAGEGRRAADFFARAGALARARYVNDRAIRYFERALENVGDENLDRKLEILRELTVLHERVGDFDAAIERAQDLSELSWLLADAAYGGSALNLLGRTRGRIGDHDAAMKELKQALALFRSINDTSGVASALDDIGRLHWVRGAYDEAQRNYQEALELRREVGEPRAVALSLNHVGSLLLQRGQFKEALRRFREALSLRKQTNDLQGIAESLNSVGVIFAERGENSAAHKLWSEALQVAEDAGDRFLRGVLLNNLGEIEISLGDLDDAEEHLRQAAELSEASGERRLLFDAVRNLGVLESHRGNHALALVHVEEAHEISRTMKSSVLEGIALRTLGEVRARTIVADEDEATSEAERAFRRAIDIFRKVGHEAELGRAYHAYGSFLLEQGLLVQGKKHLEMAKDIFERLEMRRILEQTEEAILRL